jgi:signal transduction histidine kinase/DNA-binding response OmpR family regulator
MQNHTNISGDDLRTPVVSMDAEALVLVVEDKPEMNRFIASTLSPEYRVEVAFTGHEGLEKAKASKPDLILCDMTISDLGAERFVHEVRHQPEIEHTPIIVFDAKADDDARVRILRGGGQEYLAKPFHVEEVRTRVGNLIKEKRRADEQRILAECGSALASLDSEKALHDLVQITVRSLADYAHLYLLEESGQARRIASASRDSAHAWCAKILGITPSDKKTAHPTLTTINTRSPTLQHFDLDLDMHKMAPENVRAAWPRSVMSVPLVAGDRFLGALTVWSISRRFAQRDLQLLEELGRRCACFIENVRFLRAEKRATQAGDGFLNAIMHDLRNPLAAIILEAGLLHQRASNSDDVTRDAATCIEQSALRMNRIIQDLRDVVRLDTGQLLIHPSPQPTRQLISEVVEAQKALFRKASIQLRVDLAPELPAVCADRNRLMQVVENLLSNAMKYTKPGGVVTVGAMKLEAEVLFQVADTGSGISASELPHVFDRFWGVNEHHSRGGGLGLAISKGVIDAHGGRIWVESELGIGTRYYFTIPAIIGHN